MSLDILPTLFLSVYFQFFSYPKCFHSFLYNRSYCLFFSKLSVSSHSLFNYFSLSLCISVIHYLASFSLTCLSPFFYFCTLFFPYFLIQYLVCLCSPNAILSSLFFCCFFIDSFIFFYLRFAYLSALTSAIALGNFLSYLFPWASQIP